MSKRLTRCLLRRRLLLGFRPHRASRLSIEVPDYLATDLKIAAARQSVTVRHLVLSALMDAGYDIKAVDMEEDGRRLR